MACKTEQQIVTELTRVFMKDLKAGNEANGLGKSHSDIRAEAKSSAEVLYKVRREAFEAEQEVLVDEAAAEPGGLVQELNASKPKVKSSKSKVLVGVTVTEVNNGKVYVKFPKGKKAYPYTPGEVSLDQQDTQEVMDKYTSAKVPKKPMKEQTTKTDTKPSGDAKDSPKDSTALANSGDKYSIGVKEYMINYIKNKPAVKVKLRELGIDLKDC